MPLPQSKMVYPNGGGSDLNGLSVDLGFDGFGGWVEDEDLGLAAAGPEAVELAVHAFEPGKLWCQFLEPFAFGSQWRDASDVRGACPELIFHVFDGSFANRDDFSAGAPEGIDFIEDGLVDDFALENDQGFVALGLERAIADEEFVEDIEFAEVAEWNAGGDGGLQAAAEAIERGGTVNGDFGFAGLAGEEADVALDVRSVVLEFIREELGRAAGGIREHPADEAIMVKAGGGFGAFLGAIKLISSAHPFVAENRALTIGGLDNDGIFTGHLPVAGTVSAPRYGIDAAGIAAGFDADFFGGEIFEDGFDRLFGEINNGLMIPSNKIEPAPFILGLGESLRCRFKFFIC